MKTTLKLFYQYLINLNVIKDSHKEEELKNYAVDNFIILQEEKSKGPHKPLPTNPNCRLDRNPKDCCIIQNTSFKECIGCGHSK